MFLLLIISVIILYLFLLVEGFVWIVLTIVFILLQWSVWTCGNMTGWLLGQNVMLVRKIEESWMLDTVCSFCPRKWHHAQHGCKTKHACFWGTLKGTYFSALKQLGSHVFLFLPACMFLILAASSARLTQPKKGCVTKSLSNMFGNSNPCCGKLAKLISSHFDMWLGKCILVCDYQLCAVIQLIPNLI